MYMSKNLLSLFLFFMVFSLISTNSYSQDKSKSQDPKKKYADLLGKWDSEVTVADNEFAIEMEFFIKDNKIRGSWSGFSIGDIEDITYEKNKLSTTFGIESHGIVITITADYKDGELKGLMEYGELSIDFFAAKRKDKKK